MRAISSAVAFPAAGARRNRPEAQRIEHRNWPRAHGKNIAQNSADARGRALKRLDETRMVVRFDFENGDEAVADIHHSRVFSGPLHHMRAARRQALQMDAARFVGAVLAPADAEDAQFGEVRVAAQDFLDASVFAGRKPVLGRDLRSDFNFGVYRCHEGFSDLNELRWFFRERKFSQQMKGRASTKARQNNLFGLRPQNRAYLIICRRA